VRNAISLGGDADTMACITGGIAYYGGTPQDLVTPVMARLDERLVAVIERFREHFGLI
jgi:ADP-ribosylglycohydrolase